MKKLYEIVNEVLESNELDTQNTFKDTDNLKDDLGMDSFNLAELTVMIEDEFDIERHDAGKPAMAVNDVWLPSEFFDGFEYAAAKEHGAFVVVRVEGAVFFLQTGFALEVVVVVYEVDLHSGC